MFGFSIKKIALYGGLVLVGVILGAALIGNKTPSDEVTPQIPTTQSPSQEVSTSQKEAVPESGMILVVRVIDGDTIELENGQRVRYIGIDTPETVDPRKPVQCFGVEASNRNKQLVEGKRVRLEKDLSETDQYGRLLRYVYVNDIFVNLSLVQDGFAYSSSYPPDVKYQSQFTEAQRIALEQKKGLWDSCPASSPTSAPSSTQSPTPTTAPSDQSSSQCVIKGNISSGGKIYHLPGCGSYSQTIINEVQGEKWFCTEEEALSAGWRKAKNCP